MTKLEENIAKAKAMRLMGMTYQQIAERRGASIWAVTYWLNDARRKKSIERCRRNRARKRAGVVK